MLRTIYRLINKLLYTVLYYIIGFKGMVKDIVHKKHNHVKLMDKTGYVAVITGGARGIGSHVVSLLMQCNVHVVIGCRNVDAGKRLIDDIRKKGVTTGEATVLQVDMKSLKSVRCFAMEVSKKYDYINLLINNAGIMFVPYEETEDGFESHFQVNYLGHFLLSHLLLPKLKNATTFNANPRIVNVSSCAHEVSPRINFNDLNMKHTYIENAAYSQSKLCQILFTKILQRKLRESGSQIQVFAVHPGIVDTEIFNGTFMKMVAPWFISLVCKRPIEGAVSIVHACISEDLEGKGGSYYANCRPSSYIEYVDDISTQEQLYDVSMAAIKSFC